MKRRDYLKRVAGASGALTGGLSTLGTASAVGSYTVHFHSVLTDNYPSSIETDVWDTMENNMAQIDDQVANDWSVEVIPEPAVTPGDLEGYIDPYLDNPDNGFPVFQAWWDWMEDTNGWISEHGHLTHFLADLTTGQWDEWHTADDADNSTSGGNIWDEGEAFAYNRIVPADDDKSQAAKWTCGHEVGHVLLGYNDSDHGLGDKYDDADTVMYWSDEGCGGEIKPGPIPRYDMYGHDTVEAIDWCAERLTSYC